MPKTKKRNKVIVNDIPDALFKKIKSKSKPKRITMGNEVLTFLEENYK